MLPDLIAPVKIIGADQPSGRWGVGMPRARWFIVGFLVVAALAGTALNARGPFAQHPSRAYVPFLTDFEAGRVEQIVLWRDQLEVTESGQLLTVVVPPGADLMGDLALARQAGGVAINLAQIPDAWLGLFTPWIPVLILLTGALIWATGIARNRRMTSGTEAGAGPQPAS
jgi:hypothetical protein